MKRIQDLVDRITDELDSAKAYAEEYLDRKAANDTSLANRYREMANDELKHAGYIHDRAMAEIDKLKGVYQPPAEMEEYWRTEHKQFIEKSAWIKQMLTL